MLKKVKTQITYRVPGGCYCNHTVGILGTPTKDKCRFCVKDRGGYVCVLHNIPLTVEAKELPLKCRNCVKATAGFQSVVEDEEPVHVDPQAIIKMAVDDYRKIYKKLRTQGYPESMADKLAKKYMEDKQ